MHFQQANTTGLYQKIMRFIYSHILLRVLLVAGTVVFANKQPKCQIREPNFSEKFNEALADQGNINFAGKLNKTSLQGSSLDFLYLSYNINARNIMFKATKDVKYLQQNFNIITNTLNAGKRGKNNGFVWFAHSKSPKYASVNNKEVILYEGYIFRYIAEYQYLVEKNLDWNEVKKLQIPVNYTESVFLKWYNRSMVNYKDDSYLQHVRTHIGAHWAIVAMYLYRLSTNNNNRKIYYNFFTRYNAALRQNFKADSATGTCSWNQTYDQPFTNLQKKREVRMKHTDLIQDAAHGNHVVLYILCSYELKLNDWSESEIHLLINTLKTKIWDKNRLLFNDNIDGSLTEENEFLNTGWKQSDGWMKLMFYDKSLYFIYLPFYIKNSKFIDKTYLSLQFYANFVRYEKLYF